MKKFLCHQNHFYECEHVKKGNWCKFIHYHDTKRMVRLGVLLGIHPKQLIKGKIISKEIKDANHVGKYVVRVKVPFSEEYQNKSLNEKLEWKKKQMIDMLGEEIYKQYSCDLNKTNKERYFSPCDLYVEKKDIHCLIQMKKKKVSKKENPIKKDE